MNVLLIEDDRSMAQGLKLLLGAEGFGVDVAESGQEGVELGTARKYDLVVLDLQLPDMSGLAVLKTLRNARVHTPVLILSGNGALESKVGALGIGADDYLVKPFNRNELIARARAVLRRAAGRSQMLIKVGGLTLNLENKTAEANGVDLHLTMKEYQILEALAHRKGATLSKKTLLDYLYDGRDEPEPKIIDVFICKLRRKLALALNGEQYIKTVWGRGFELREPSRLPAAA